MNLRRWFLPAMLALGLSGIYFLPSAGEIADSAVRMDLPNDMGGWSFHPRSPSEEEVKALEKGTRFAKAECRRPRPGEYTLEGYRVPDFLELSIVLSGTDLNNSIHRPERCMPAQGHVIRSSSNIRIQTSEGRSFPVKRLKSTFVVRDQNKNPVHELDAITYYFFVGHDSITNDHLRRTLTDMKDRLFRGMDQRWAYVSVSTYVGHLPWLRGKMVSEEEADQKLVSFTSELASDLIDWRMVKPTESILNRPR
ncbi:MAG: exosortase-associated EpsI family protein [Verrucomicrobiota bacterium]